MTADGYEVGTIDEVRGGTAYVELDQGTFDSIEAKLDWGDAGEDTHPIEADRVDRVTDDGVHLRQL